MKNSPVSVSTALIFVVLMLFGGVFACIVLSMLIWLSNRSFGRDSEVKHGIAKLSRLGGIGVTGSILIYYLLIGFTAQFTIFQHYQEDTFAFLGFEWACLLLGLIGLADDMRLVVSPRNRLLVTFLLAVCVFLVFPDYMALRALSFFPQIMENKFWLLLMSSLVIVGFINAGNMVDGANGLFAIIALIFFSSAYYLSGHLMFVNLNLALSVFVFYNLWTGKIFLGDFGSYGLSAMIVLTSFYLYDEIIVSVWIFASLLSYPCIEILRVIVSRIKSGSSPMQADNSHIHNLMNAYFLGLGWSANLANSITGFTMALASSLLPFVLLIGGVSTKNNEFWSLLFLIQAFFFLLLYRVLKNSVLVNHHQLR